MSHGDGARDALTARLGDAYWAAENAPSECAPFPLFGICMPTRVFCSARA